MKIKSLREAVEPRGVKIAIYGDGGTGKTTQIASLIPLMADDDVLLIITAEHGLRTLLQENLGITDDPRVQVAECEKISEVREAVKYAIAPSNKVKFVVVDSVSNLADRELRAMLEIEKDPRKAYGDVMLRIPTMLWAMVDAPSLNVIFIFHESRVERNEGSAKQPDMVAYYSPQVPSKGMMASMPYIFDGVLRLEQKANGERQFRTAKTSTIVAKDRTGMLDTLEPPDLGAIIVKILS